MMNFPGAIDLRPETLMALRLISAAVCTGTASIGWH